MGWVVNATLQPLYPPGKTRWPLYSGLGGPQGRSWRVRKITPPPPGYMHTPSSPPFLQAGVLRNMNHYIRWSFTRKSGGTLVSSFCHFTSADAPGSCGSVALFRSACLSSKPRAKNSESWNSQAAGNRPSASTARGRSRSLRHLCRA
jgi:hypothetical protein